MIETFVLEIYVENSISTLFSCIFLKVQRLGNIW